MKHMFPQGRHILIWIWFFCVLLLVNCGTTAGSGSSSDSGDDADNALQRFQGYWLEDSGDNGYQTENQRLLLYFTTTTLTFYATDASDITTDLGTYSAWRFLSSWERLPSGWWRRRIPASVSQTGYVWTPCRFATARYCAMTRG